MHLPKIFGIKPRIYLALLYSFILLIILFFILLFPGIYNMGTVFVINSDPQGAAVRIDDIYYDVTPCRLFIPKGNHQITVLSPDFTPYQSDVQVKGRPFASILFPLTIKLNAKLSAPDPLTVLANQASEYASWSFTGEPTASYQIPQPLSEGVYRIGAKAPAFEDVLKSAARFATTKAALRDLTRAKFLLDNAGNAPSALTALQSVQEILSWLSNTPNSAKWLASVLPNDMTSELVNSEWFNKQYVEENAAAPSYRQGQVVIETLVFNEAQNLWAAQEVVSKEQWDAFVEAKPEWGEVNIDNLYDKGLIDADYLENSSGEARTNISWHAAKAYCDWLTTLLPQSFSGWKVKLPNEEEWKLSLHPEVRSNVWEWCDDFFAPIDYLPAPFVIESPQMLIMGRTPEGEESRASLTPESCSPVVSFRPIIVMEEVL